MPVKSSYFYFFWGTILREKSTWPTPCVMVLMLRISMSNTTDKEIFVRREVMRGVWGKTLTVTKVGCAGLISDATTAFNQKVVNTFLCPSLFETLSSGLQAFSSEVIQHDHISSSSNGFICFLFRLTFDFDFKRKASNCTGRLNSLRNGTMCPNVIVLEHNHGR